MANSVREFVIESLRGFYERLPLKKVAIDGSVLTPDASGIVNLNVASSEQLEDMALTTAAALNDLNERIPDMSSYVKKEELEEVELSTAMALNDLDARISDVSSSSPWESGDGENSAQLRGTTGAIGDGAVAHFENRSFIETRGRSIQLDDSSTVITYVSEWTISGNTNGTYYDVSNGSFVYPENTIVFIEYNGVKRMVTGGYQNYLNTDYPFVFSDYNEGGSVEKGGTREITDTYLDNVHVNVTEVTPLLIGSGAVGSYSHVEGVKTSALGDYSHAEGASEIHINTISVYSSENIETINGEYWTFSTNYGFVTLISYSDSFKIPSQITIYSDPECQTVITVIDDVESNHIVYIDNSDMGSRYYLVFNLPSEYANLPVFDIDNGGFLYCYIKDNGGAFANYSHAEGYNTKAGGLASHAEGYYTVASGVYSHAEGSGTNAKSDYSHAEGVGTTAEGYGSHAEGSNTNAEGHCSHAEGYNTNAKDEYSHAEGNDVSANASYSHAEGYQTLTWSRCSHAEGYNTATFMDTDNSYQSNAHAEGSGTITMSVGAHAEGYGNNDNTVNIQGRDWNNYVDASYVKEIYGSNRRKLYKLNGFHFWFSIKRKLNTLRVGDVIWSRPDYNNKANRAIIDYVTDQDGSIYVGLPSYDFTVYNNIIPKFGTAIGKYAHSEGAYTVADGSMSHSEGCFTIAMGEGSHAEGYETYAFGLGSHAEGYYNIAAGKYSHAEGGADSSDASTTITYGHVPSNYSYTDATPYVYSCAGPLTPNSGSTYKYLDIAVGTALTDGSNYYYVVDKRDNITSIYSSNRYSAIILDKPIITIDSSLTIPCFYNSAKGVGSHAEGFNTKALSNYSHTEGYNAKALGLGSHAEGYQTRGMSYINRKITVNKDSSRCTVDDTSGILADNVIMQNGKYAVVRQVINSSTLLLDRSLSPDASVDASGFFYGGKYAAGDYSHTEGYETFTIKPGSHAEGYRTIANGDYSHAEGYGASTFGMGSHAEGYYTIANGYYSHAEGESTKASGESSHVEGYGTIANGNYSHAEGYYTIANSAYSHAEGNYTVTRGLYSHAEGIDTTAIGSCSHVEGVGSRNVTVRISYAGKGSLTYTTASPHMFMVGDMLKYGSTRATVTAVDSSTSFTVNTTLNPYEIWNARNITFAYFRGGDTSYGVTIGHYSHAEGVTRTNNDYEHAEGVWNVSHKNSSLFDASCGGNTLFSIGAGIEAPSNAVEVMQNGDVYVRGIGNYDGSNYIDASTLQEVINNSGGGGGTATDLMTSVTYSDLKNLRDSSSLVPGMQYHIYDYVTTVGDASLSSAMHPFGIIVTANSPSELDESARICKAENDEYYTNLDAYEIKYCIDNDSSRFGWVDSNGKGVIYYMKDDNRNEAHYDFTNILFDNKYTFDYNGTDARLNASANIHDNVIGPHYGGYASAGSQQTYYTLSPNNIVFEGLMNYSNTFGNDCYDMKFSNQTLFNTFDGAVWDCSFGATTLYNHFGSYITGSVFPAKLATSDIGSNTWYVNVSGTTSYIRCRIMPSTKGTSTSSRLSISITETGQHAGLNSSGVLKKWLPADLIN